MKTPKSSKEDIEDYVKNPIQIRKLLKSSDNKQGIHFLAQYFLKKYHFLTFEDTYETFIYVDGVYEAGGDKKIAQETQGILSDLCNVHLINELLGHIRRSTHKKREIIKEPEQKMCLQNGILNLDTSEIEPHSPDIIFFNKLPVIFDKNADCPNIKKFLNEVISVDSILVLQELAGYCLFKRYFIHKAFMLVGKGANGKSTLILLLKSFLGSQNCASISLQQLEKNQFASSVLFGKLSNIFADLPAKALKDTSLFKMLTGEDLIMGEKKFKDQFFYINYAKLIFSCNQIPVTSDDSDAFFRRWEIIDFPNQFIDNADKGLIKKLTTPEELSGFLNFAIEGLRRLLDQGDFSNSKSIQEVREIYLSLSDSVVSFATDCLSISPDEFVEKKKVYTHYADYCRKKKYPIDAENAFHKRLQKHIRIEEYRPSIDGIRVQCWKGIKIKGDNDIIENNPDNPDADEIFGNRKRDAPK